MKTIKELIDLKERKALVVGGAGHIGFVACEALKELGARVAVLDLEPKGELSFCCDLRDEKATRNSVREVIKTLGGLDVLIHSAAYVGTTKDPGWAVSFKDQTVQAWDAALRVNLTAAFVLAQEAQEVLAQSGHGSILFISSIYGVRGHDARLYEGTDMHFPFGYSASKGGLLQLMRQLATSFAPKIRVNAISPGGVLRGQSEDFQKRYVAKTPLRRMATEEDLKGAIAYLASDLSKYVTGHNLLVDGGWTAW